MRLYKNVSKTLLAVKTPRRIYVEPGMVIDVDALGDISHSDIAMFIDRGYLVSMAEAKKAQKGKETAVPVKSSSGKPTTEVVADGKTTVVRSTVPEETNEETKVEVGKAVKMHAMAAVITAPADTNAGLNPAQTLTKGEAFYNLPQDVRDKIAAVEAIAAGAQPAPPVDKAPKKKKSATKSK